LARTQSSRRTSPRPAKRSRGLTWGLIGLGVLAALFAVAFLLTPDPAPELEEYGVVSVSGDPLAAFDGNPNSDPAVGEAIPEIVGTDFESNPVAIQNDGRPKVILFLAHWCPHCQREVPAIISYLDAQDFTDRVDLYSVATASAAERPNWPPSAWLEREGWPFPVLVDDEQYRAFRAFGEGNFPYYVFVDSQGQVALRLSGEQAPAVLAEIMEALP
jgi:thiol-disulfide isomerase/thioredoxin